MTLEGLPPDTFDDAIVNARIAADGGVILNFSKSAGKIPAAPGPVVVVPQTTVLLLAAWLQTRITGDKIDAMKKGPGAEKTKSRDFDEIKKFIDDLQKQLPGIVGQIRGIFPHPITKSLETAMSRPFQGIVEDVLSENPLLREKLKELIKNQLEDSIAQDEKWQQGEDGGEEQA